MATTGLQLEGKTATRQRHHPVWDSESLRMRDCTVHISSDQPEEFASQLEPFAAELVTIDALRSRGFHAAARAWSLGDVRMFQVAVGHARFRRRHPPESCR